MLYDCIFGFSISILSVNGLTSSANFSLIFSNISWLGSSPFFNSGIIFTIPGVAEGV